MMKKHLLFCVGCLLAAAGMWAQGPNETGTYYRRAHGKSGEALKTALWQIVRGPSVLTYGDLWQAYRYTDVRDDGYLWDIYSNVTMYEDPVSCSHTNSSEGSGINREHSMPKSWFYDMKPAYTDLTHVIPTDGYINNMRSDLPYGETTSPTKGSANMYSKVGPCSVPGYTGKIFEPADEWKGDLARIYFYMATCYEDEVAGFKGDMFGGDSYLAYAEWSMAMLLRWAAEDPVSEKEVKRNEAVWRLQGNRNPFVDYPGLERYVWGESSEALFSYDGSDAAVAPEVVPAQSCEIALNRSTFGVDAASGNARDYWERYPLTLEQNGISVSYNYGTEGQHMYASQSQIRLYQSNTLTFHTEQNAMTSIELTVVRNDSQKQLVANGEELADNVWTGEANEVQFMVTEGNGHIQISKAKITVSAADGIDMVYTTAPVYDDQTYTLAGVRVDDGQLRPGIYIRNGKKFVVK